MHLSGDAKFIIGVVFVTVAIVVGGVMFMSRPEPTFSRSELIAEDTLVKGKKDTPTYLVEFSDFQCPACLAYKPTVDTILKTYGDKLLFGYRHFPLSQHPYGEKAAIAAEAANEQGKFWEMYDYLFSHQATLSDETVLAGAKEIGLDIPKFQQALTADKHKSKVTSDASAGKRLGVDATPTFYLNGKKLISASPADLTKAVDEAVKAAK